jgi:YidC/Oxa1 family membrane protein insertase
VAGAGGDRVEVATDRLRLVFAQDGGDPVVWQACHPSCRPASEAPGTTVTFTRGERPPVRLVVRGPNSDLDLSRRRFATEITDTARGRLVTFRSEVVGGVGVEKSFEVSRHGYEVVMTVRLIGPDAAAWGRGRRLDLELDAAAGLAPPPAAGFSAALEGLRRVALIERRVTAIADDRPDRAWLRPEDWAGFRSRFWTLLVRPGQGVTLQQRAGAGGALVLEAEAGAPASRYTFYGGPVEYAALTGTDPELGRLLFSSLWFWLRALSLALLVLLGTLTTVIGHPGPAIVALAVTVKILLLPLTLVADRLQRQVNATEARLQPRIDAIKAAHQGEARTRRIVELYREERVHPLYTLKSLLGVLIQIPMFIAVFDMLAENFVLYRVPFLWIADLSRPDELAALPVGLPFFGRHLNLLPFLMTGIALTASLRFDSTVLTPALVHRQRRSLAGLALVFFVLFYTFPAGMVLYWTSTNALTLASREVGRWRRRRRRRARVIDSPP